VDADRRRRELPGTGAEEHRRQARGTTSEALGALGDPTRRLIFETLAAGPLPVGELARSLPITRPAVSQHLRALKDAGLVTDRPSGTRRIYQVDPNGVAALRAYLDQVWGKALGAYIEPARPA